PPCSTKLVNKDKSLSHETAPLDLPPTPWTSAPLGRKVLPLLPTPPPRDMISITSSRWRAIPLPPWSIRPAGTILKFFICS
ncbi:10904_t:CDS:2, partial [Racocetra persica]